MQEEMQLTSIPTGKEEIYGYIYKTTNKINNRYYIGQRKGNKKDETYKGSGKILKLAIIKYGWDNFFTEVLSFHLNKKALDNEEIRQIKIAREKGDNIYNITSGGDGLDSETARKLAIKRWSVIAKDERSQLLLKAREKSIYNRKNNLTKYKLCNECFAKHGHKKICSQYKERKICNECSGIGVHKKECSKFKKWNISEETRQKLREIALNRPPSHAESISKTLKKRWKEDNDFVKSMTCLECGAKSNNHKSHCSKVRTCNICNAKNNSHKKECERYIPQKKFLCSICQKTIRGKGNYKQHLGKHARLN